MNTFIANITEKAGDTIEIALKVADISEHKTKNGAPYVVIELTDGKKSLSTRKWNMNIAGLGANLVVGNVLVFTLSITEYNGSNSYTVDKYREVEAEDNVDKEQFDTELKLNIEEMMNYLDVTIDSLRDPDLRNVVMTIFLAFKEKIKTNVAATSVHHNIKGGLLYHIFRMTKMAEEMCKIYKLDRDVLISAVICHDIGKVYEIETDETGKSHYTTKGILFGHLYLGGQIIHATAESVNALKSDKVMQLEHAVISHHDHLEWDAIKKPSTAEAYALFLLDMMDSRMYIYEDMYSKMDNFEMSENGVKNLDNAYVYRGERNE